MLATETVLYIKEALQQHIFPKEIGFRSARNVMNSNVTFISRFELRHRDMIAFSSLQ
jgi:hypothetical protein